jgi:hypothetical protein
MGEDKAGSGISRSGSRPERKFAWILICAGTGLFLGWLVWKFIVSLREITLSVSNVSLGLIILGAVILVFSVLAERIAEIRDDRYRDVEK